MDRLARILLLLRLQRHFIGIADSGQKHRIAVVPGSHNQGGRMPKMHDLMPKIVLKVVGDPPSPPKISFLGRWVAVYTLFAAEQRYRQRKRSPSLWEGSGVIFRILQDFIRFYLAWGRAGNYYF